MTIFVHALEFEMKICVSGAWEMRYACYDFLPSYSSHSGKKVEVKDSLQTHRLEKLGPNIM